MQYFNETAEREHPVLFSEENSSLILVLILIEFDTYMAPCR
jgi:hypothetical protein